MAPWSPLQLVRVPGIIYLAFRVRGRLYTRTPFLPQSSPVAHILVIWP